MTAPKPANLADVNRTVSGLLKWLRNNGHTDHKTAAALTQDVVDDGNPHPAGSVPGIVTEALLRAYGTRLRTGSDTGQRAVSALRATQTQSKALASALSELDREIASRGQRLHALTFSELGNRVLATLARIQARLEGFGRRTYPTTLGEWRKFTAQTSAALLGAGMSWDDVTSLFPESGADSAVSRERLRKRVDRRRQQLQARAARKKVPGRSG